MLYFIVVRIGLRKGTSFCTAVQKLEGGRWAFPMQKVAMLKTKLLTVDKIIVTRAKYMFFVKKMLHITSMAQTVEMDVLSGQHCNVASVRMLLCSSSGNKYWN